MYVFGLCEEARVAGENWHIYERANPPQKGSSWIQTHNLLDVKQHG